MQRIQVDKLCYGKQTKRKPSNSHLWRQMEWTNTRELTCPAKRASVPGNAVPLPPRKNVRKEVVIATVCHASDVRSSLGILT